MFAGKTELLSGNEVHMVGSFIHQEYWLPAEGLSRFKANIAGKIRIVVEFFAK
jgi:hypothetical protein